MLPAGIMCSRNQILNAAWGIDLDTGTNMVNVNVHLLWKKLKAHGLGVMLKTIRGMGFRLENPVPGDASS
jgi:two-component system response regulator CiaR